MLDGKGNLILVFANSIVKDMIVKKDATDILSESATTAYGMSLRVVYATKNDDLNGFAAVSDEQTQKPIADSFDSAVDLLKEISQQDGFEIEFN